MASADAQDSIPKGLALRLFAIALMATMSAVIKLAEQRGARLAELLFFRQAMAVPLVLGWIVLGPGLVTVRTRRFGAHATRAAYGLAGMICTFGSILLLPLAEAVTLQFTAPIFATILGALVLREPTGKHRWSAVVLGFVGVLIVAQPSGGHIPLFGAGVGLFAAFMVGLIAIQLRAMGRTESTGATVLWFSILSLPPLVVFYWFQAQPHEPMVWAMLVAVGLMGGMGQLALTASLRHAPVSAVVPMDYSSLIWATLWGWLWFGTLPTQATWIGAAVIVTSGLYIAGREHRLRLAKPVEPEL